MTRFTDDLLQNCKKITDIMCKSPCCKLFLDPVDPVDDDMPDYYNVVTEPQDLNTIKRRLNDNCYETLENWENDMLLVFENAKDYYQPSSIEALMAQNMDQKFQKLCKKLLTTRKKWSERIYELYGKVNYSLKAAPPILMNEFKGRDFDGPVTHEEMEKLCVAASSLTSKNDVYQIMQLLSLFKVKLNVNKKEEKIKLAQLPTDAVQALTLFVKEKYKAANKKYPQ